MKDPSDEDLTVTSHINLGDFFSHPQLIQAACFHMHCSSFGETNLLPSLSGNVTNIGRNFAGTVDSFFVSKEITVQIKPYLYVRASVRVRVY